MWDADVIRWRKSSRSDSSGGACVEVGSFVPVAADQWHGSDHRDDTGGRVEAASITSTSAAEWKKSSHSDSSGAECVEVADLAAAVAVRDSKDPDGPKLMFGPEAWRAFAGRVKGGHLDLT